MHEQTLKKLTILAESAKYDVSCSSSGSSRKNQHGGIGFTTGRGICHSFADDGRCISLLKILYTNVCMYDCAYCINRRSNDIARASFTVAELVELTLEFYHRNYIEGLFLSSAVSNSPDYTMERMVHVLRTLRTIHRFNGYVHMKCIPGASPDLVQQAGLYADRLSVNIEIPSEQNLRFLAPEKDHQSVYAPMRSIRQGILESREEQKNYRTAPRFAPAGQSTQMIIGASNEHDREILQLSSMLYRGPELKRVYYSSFIPINAYDSRLPALAHSSLVRENRLYQADWLMRLYQFEAEELTDEAHPDLDLNIDPKLAWALRHPEYFPLDVNRAEYAELLRVPGIGLQTAQRIVASRRHGAVTVEHMKKMGTAMNRAQYFLSMGEKNQTIHELGPERVRAALSGKKKTPVRSYQLSLFGDPADTHGPSVSR